jgi:hypothetical protein
LLDFETVWFLRFFTNNKKSLAHHSDLNIPAHILPAIRSNSEVYGRVSDGVLKGVPIAGVCFSRFDLEGELDRGGVGRGNWKQVWC